MATIAYPTRYAYETVAASQTGQILGTAGAKGDYLHRLILVVSTAATAATSIIDGVTSITIFPNSPGSGVQTYVVEVGLASQTGAWSITTGAGTALIAVGIFSV